MTRQLIEAALRASPGSATIDHLKRLAMHKRLGSNDAERAILLNDYAEALLPYSDFVVYLACKMLWENTENEFYPKIKTIREICETLHRDFSGRMARLSDQKAVAAPPRRSPAVREEDSERGKIARRQLCDFLISKGKPDYYDQVRFWSNYDLEKEAAYHGYGKDAGPVAASERKADAKAVPEQNAPAANVEA